MLLYLAAAVTELTHAVMLMWLDGFPVCGLINFDDITPIMDENMLPAHMLSSPLLGQETSM